MEMTKAQVLIAESFINSEGVTRLASDWLEQDDKIQELQTEIERLKTHLGSLCELSNNRIVYQSKKINILKVQLTKADAVIDVAIKYKEADLKQWKVLESNADREERLKYAKLSQIARRELYQILSAYKKAQNPPEQQQGTEQ